MEHLQRLTHGICGAYQVFDQANKYIENRKEK